MAMGSRGGGRWGAHGIRMAGTRPYRRGAQRGPGEIRNRTAAGALAERGDVRGEPDDLPAERARGVRPAVRPVDDVEGGRRMAIRAVVHGDGTDVRVTDKSGR